MLSTGQPESAESTEDPNNSGPGLFDLFVALGQDLEKLPASAKSTMSARVALAALNAFPAESQSCESENEETNSADGNMYCKCNFSRPGLNRHLPAT